MLVTGASGLLLHGVLAEEPEDVELLLPAARRLCERLDVCLHRTRMFDDVRFQTVGDAPVAAVPRLFADYAPHSNVNDLCRDLATALRLRKTTLQLVARELEQRKRFPGRTNLRLAHGYVSGEVNHSNSERLGKRLLSADGLEFHRKPLAIEHQGRLVAELDIPFPELHYAVEIDGPHHLLPHVAAADRQRDRLLGTVGWRIDRFFWFEIEERGAWFVSQVRTAISERAAAR